ncbi:IS66-like element accessory protein TnpA [Aquibium oceanicum]|uniref:IS66-like element accessory protein TnpA n=1 Tax=Aquibium oceanicum TaxID=1670800 RepID=UPI000A8C35FF|nr:transposase [Aquibium oceanicum]
MAILLEDRFVSGLDHRLEPEGEIRRFEVINGAMGRRRWSADDRARILEETLAPGAVVSAVARRHDLTPQQLFTWRREARKRAEADAKALAFVPALVAPEPATQKELKPPRAKRRAPRRRTASIEVEASGVTVRIGDGASSATIAAVIRALKVTS